MDSMWNQLIQEANEDPSLQDTLNVDELLRTAARDDEDETLEDIADQVARALTMNSTDVASTVHRLRKYRYVSHVDALICGRYIRWIRRRRRSNEKSECRETDQDENELPLEKGGLLSDVKFLDNGVHLSALSPGTRYPRRIKYDNYLIFQRLTEDEMLVLFAKETAGSRPIQRR